MISLAAFKLLASGALDGLLRGLSAALKWLLADWRNLAITALALFGGFHHFILNPRMDRLLTQSEQLIEDTQLAHLGTISNYIDASAQAKREAEANAARVRAEQEAVTHEVTRDLRSDLAAVTARFDRLRARNAASVHSGGARAADLSGPGGAPGRAAGATGDQDLPAAGELSAGDLTPQPLCPAGLVCLTIDEAEKASEDAHRHDRLIDWAIGQSLIRFAPAESPE